MNLREQFIKNEKEKDFFFWRRKMSEGENIKDLWLEIDIVDREITRLLLKRKKLATSSIVIGNNILRKEN